MEELIVGINERYNALPEQEKELIKKLKNTKQGLAVAKVLGPELSDLISQLDEAQVPVGLGARR